MKVKKENYIKICPKCGSINISPYSEIGLYQGDFFLEHCEDCSYISSVFLEIEKSKIIEFRKKLKNESKINNQLRNQQQKQSKRIQTNS